MIMKRNVITFMDRYLFNYSDNICDKSSKYKEEIVMVLDHNKKDRFNILKKFEVFYRKRRAERRIKDIRRQYILDEYGIAGAILLGMH